MNNPGVHPTSAYRDEIVGSLTPVRPLPPPLHRAWTLLPPALLLATAAPLLIGQRGDLERYAPLLTWGVTGLQALLGLWLLTLAFREAVPGRNVSWRVLALAATLTPLCVLGIALLTNAASPRAVPAGREVQFWVECVLGPLAIGTPFMIVATLMAVRAFPTRPAILGALCGTSAGILSDAGWRLSCWFSEPAHIIGSHGLAILGLTIAGSLVAIVADAPRWRRLRGAST
jgi:hypothetical protein